MDWDSGKRGYLALECGDGTVLSDWEAAADIRSAVLTRQLGDEKSLTIGAVCPAEVTLTMKDGVDSGTSFRLLLGQEEDGEVNWQSLGHFTVRSCTKEETFYTVEASDALAGLETAFDGAENWESGCALEDVLTALCSQAGITAASSVPGEADATVVSGIPAVTLSCVPAGLTLRELLGYLAALAGCSVLLDEEGQLVFRWFSDRSAEVDAGESYEGSWSVKTESRTVEALRFTVETETEDGLSAAETIERNTGNSGVTLSAENPLITEENIDAAWQRVRGFSYEMGELAMPGLPAVTAGDCLIVTESDGTKHTLPIVMHKLEYDGGLKSTLAAPSQTEEEEETSHQGTVGKALSTLSAEIGRFQSLYADYVEAAEGRFTALETETLTAERIDVDDLFAQDIEASGTISGATIKGSTFQGCEMIYVMEGDETEETAGHIYFNNGIHIEAAAGLPLYYEASRGHQFTGPIYAENALHVSGDSHLEAIYGDYYVDGKSCYGLVDSDYVAFKPYYCAGDSVSGLFYTGGYITSGGTGLRFSVPLAKPIIGSPSVTVTDVDGVVVRQDGKYCFGSDGTPTYAAASSYKASVGLGGNMVNVVAEMANSTNVVNNDACGIEASIKITFS